MSAFSAAAPAFRRRTLAGSPVLAITPVLVLVAAVVTWGVSLTGVHAAVLGEFSPMAMPAGWYAALGVVLIGAVLTIWGPRPRGWLMTAYIGALIVMLVGTVPLITDTPAYAWTYKHIGVTRLIEATGTVHPSVDIYNRWPGLFALAAAFSRLTGTDALGYAKWFELAFTLIDSAIVAAIARSISRDTRVAAGSALLFAVSNWVGQNYFSPQALAYTLYLTALLVLLRGLSSPTAVSPWIARRLEAITRRPQKAPRLAQPGLATPSQSIAIVVALDLAIVATHQLTPYMLIVQVAALVAVGAVGPRWLVVILAVLALAYVIPNFSYIEQHYGLFGNLNPLTNAQVQTGFAAHAGLYAHVGEILTIAIGVTALWAAGRLSRSGLACLVTPVLALALAPFVILAVQNYGGEAPLRVVLFASPWLSMLVAWGITSLPHVRRLRAGAAATTVASALFLFAFPGYETTNRMPRDEVLASEYFNRHAPIDSVLMMAGENFPHIADARAWNTRISSTYGDGVTSLFYDPRLAGRQLNARDVPIVVQDLRNYSPHGFIVFSATQLSYARYMGTTPGGALESLETSIARSRQFTLWYANRDTRIYELTSTAPRLRASQRERGLAPRPARTTRTARRPRPARRRHAAG